MAGDGVVWVSRDAASSNPAINNAGLVTGKTRVLRVLGNVISAYVIVSA